MATPERPLSPHLQVYRPQITMVLSIVHRITGVILAFGAFGIAWWRCSRCRRVRLRYGQFMDIAAGRFRARSYWAASAIAWSITCSMACVICGGTAGKASRSSSSRLTGWTVVVLSFVLTGGTLGACIDPWRLRHERAGHRQIDAHAARARTRPGFGERRRAPLVDAAPDRGRAGDPHAVVHLAVGVVDRRRTQAHARATIANPRYALPLLAFVLALFWHAKLGLQVVIEDYVHPRWLELAAQVAVTFACAGGALASVFAIVRIMFAP